jgi:putative ABC transport system permease protein
MVGVAVVAQTLYTATVEHHKEFATIKAIGGRNSDVYRIIAEQATIAAVLGFAAGAALARAARPVLLRMDLKVILTPQHDLIVLAATLALCLAAALVSFRTVAALDPAMVFRD